MKKGLEAEKIPAAKTSMLVAKDKPLFRRLVNRIRGGLKDLGDYTSLDDVWIEEAAKALIYKEKAERWLDHAQTAREFAQGSDACMKHQASLAQAIDRLAASRADRLTYKTHAEAKDQLEKFFSKIKVDEEGKKPVYG